MNRKLALIPTVLISSALLLTACSSGNGQHNSPSQPAAAPTSSSAPSSNAAPAASSAPTVIAGYVAPPSGMAPQYKVMFRAFETNNPQLWQSAAAAGAKKYSEDPTPRSLSLSDYEKLRSGGMNSFNDLMKVNREIESDFETSAQNISDFLAKNPNATLNDINADKSLLVNRYQNVYTADVQQDSATKFFFVVFTLNDPNFRGVRTQGILVPQAGKTPDFHTTQEDASSAAQQ